MSATTTLARRNTSRDYVIQRFDLKNLEHGRLMLFCGGTATGKTVTVVSILHHFRDYQHGLVFSATESLNGTYGKHWPGVFIHESWKPELIHRLFDNQTIKAKEIERVEEELQYCRRNGRHRDVEQLTRRIEDMKKRMRAILILDDMVYDARVAKSDALRRCAFQSRHHHVSVFLVVQYSMLLPTCIRANVSYCFFTRENIISNRKRLHEHFAGVVDFNTFERIMDSCTQNYEVLVVNRLSSSTNPTHVLFWYKANPPYNFKMGSAAMWAFHQKHYDQHHVERRIQKTREQAVSNGIKKGGTLK